MREWSAWKASRLLATALLLLTTARGWAQQSYRSSLAGDAASAGRRASQSGNYNLLIGPVRLKLDAGLETEFNDNVFTAPEGGNIQSDLFFRPRLNVGATWQLTSLNALTLRLGTSYEFSLNNTRTQNITPFAISPDSQLSFDIFVGDFRITLFDSFSLANNASSQSAASNTVGFSQFSNDLGVTVLWDLNDLVLTLRLDERTDIFTGSTDQSGANIDLARADRNTLSAQLSSAFLLSDTMTVGVQGSAQLSEYSSGSREQVILGAGPFAQFQISAYTRVLAAGGLQASETTGGATFRVNVPARESSFRVTAPARSGEMFSDEELAQQQAREQDSDVIEDGGLKIGYYWSLSILNRLNASYTHSVTAGHERTFGIAADYQDIDYVRYEASWQFLRPAALSGSVGYERVTQLNGPLQQSYFRWTFGLAIGYQVTQHLRAALRYTLYAQDSDRFGQAYDQTLTTLSLTYDF